jgi:cell division protein FtsI/penicillin-binding protein 2
MRAGERFVLSAVWPARGQILAADGTVLSSPAAVARSGSISLLTGNVVAATAAQAKALGAPYQKGDLIGQGGIEQAYQALLAGRPALIIRIEGPGTKVDATAARFPATPGRSVQTSIVMRDQLAAAHAVAGAATSKPVDMVVLQPSTGQVLAVIERPGGFDRALQGIFPPGSTFKIVTASALTRKGLRPSTTVQCPPTVNIGGRTFHNFDNEHLGTTSLLNAFAVSCNTTFAMLAAQHLTGSALHSMAEEFGFNAKPSLGIPAVLGKFSTPHQPVDLAADAFGQGTDLVNPLSQAAEAAAIQDGTWRPPVLVTSPAPQQSAQPRKLSPSLLNALRPMMRAVVTRGTAAGVGFPPGVYGKTGTAEYGAGHDPPSHAWFIGYRGNLAIAVLVEGGGVGADASAPIANAFLRRV